VIAHQPVVKVPGRAISRAGYEIPIRPMALFQRFVQGGGRRLRSLSPKLGSYSAIFTLMERGLATSFFGMLMVRTPFLYAAPTLSASTVSGRLKQRTKEP